MSVQDELLVPGINKKQVIGVILIAGILISIFAFSNFFFNALLGSQRTSPNDELADAESEDASLMLPPLPWDLDDLLDQFNFSLGQLELLEKMGLTEEDLMDILSEMQDGTVDNFDAIGFGAAIVALLVSEVEVFRVFDYESESSMHEELWRYECFDVFTGDGWESTASKNVADLFPYEDYYGDYSEQDLLRIKMSLDPSEGQNSFLIPNLFPNPYIMEDSIDSENMDDTATVMYLDDLNCTSLALYYDSAQNTSLYYELFGTSQPSSQTINQSATIADYTPSNIQTQYVKLPPSIENYLSNNPNFQYHYNILDQIIFDSDNAFTIANKIRNYMQDNFDFGTQERINDGPDEGEDVVEWFLEHEEGVWSDWASAFCAFTRAFGVASRFVDGFNSRFIDESYDEDEGKNTIVIKYKNMYNWAEIYVPFAADGSGRWVEMDVLYDSFGTGGDPLTDADFDIRLTIDKETAQRTEYVNLTAHISSEDASVNNRKIEFYDQTSGEDLGEATTGSDGNASLIIQVTDDFIVGPHFITAQVTPYSSDTSNFTVVGDIVVVIDNLNPQEVNVSNPEERTTVVNGRVYDPENPTKPIAGANVGFVLISKEDTSDYERNAFSPILTVTDPTGQFNIELEIYETIQKGEYYFRADFNGSFNGKPYAVGEMSDSSDLWVFNVTAEAENTLWFYINGSSTEYAGDPLANRTDVLVLKAEVRNQAGDPLEGQTVTFYDDTRGFTIGTETTNASGIAERQYPVTLQNYAGPNKLHANLNGRKDNYSYFVLNEKPTIEIDINSLTPRNPLFKINRTGGGTNTEFGVEGFIKDSQNHRISYANITMKLMKNGHDNSSYLTPEQNWQIADENGEFDFTFSLKSNAPLGNYTLKFDFNGTVDYTDDDNYPYLFHLPVFTHNSTHLKNPELQVIGPATLNFYINGTTKDNFTGPLVKRYLLAGFGSNFIELKVDLIEGGKPLIGETIQFYDLTNDSLIGTNITNSYGESSLKYEIKNAMNSHLVPGPHLIEARWSKTSNHSYFIIDDQININLGTNIPDPQNVLRSTSSNRHFVIRGFINDSSNLQPVKYGRIRVRFYDTGFPKTEYTSRFTLVDGTYHLNETGEIYLKYFVEGNAPRGNIQINVSLTGLYNYSEPNNIYNPHAFDLSFTTRFAPWTYTPFQLNIQDPYYISTQFKVNDTHAQPSYSDFGPKPRRFNGWENISFFVYVKNDTMDAGIPYEFYIVDLYNKTGEETLLVHYKFDGMEMGQKYFVFELSKFKLHSGLHKLILHVNRTFGGVPYEFETYNSTYIIINQSIDISAISSKEAVNKGTDSLTISGTVSANNTALRGLRVSISMYDEEGNDVSGLMVLSGASTKTITTSGTYSFTINYISSSAKRGLYYFVINFTGGIDDTDILLTDYMVHSNSSFVWINVTYGTEIREGGYYTEYDPDDWYLYDTLHVVGNLTWANGTGMDGFIVNITIKDGSDQLIESGSTTTDSYGGFDIQFQVDGDFDDDTTIYVSFYPKLGSNFGTPDGYYVDGIVEEELFRISPP